jgi:hypothetical protein
MTPFDDTPEDPLVRQEEDAAAAEAGSIGGRKPKYEDDEGRPVDEEDRALIEGGEGVEEGFEIAESDLQETASHGENRYDPEIHDFGDEESAGEGDAISGEPDEIDVTETVRDPDAGPGEDPGEGPGISHDR